MTQSDSTNIADAVISYLLRVNNFNDADIENDSTILGFTGDNFFKEVNGDLGVGTGDVDLSNWTDSMANFNTTDIEVGMGDADATAENIETQSDSTNIACSIIDRSGMGYYGECGSEGAHEVHVDDFILNENNLEADTDNFQFGDTGTNELRDVNGDADFDTGEVDESDETVVSGNMNTSNL
jgi:hypothetical protein